MARKYAPIWEQLKKTGFCIIAVPKPLHPRLVRSIRDMKYRDAAYKLLLEAEGKEATLWYRADGAKMKFYLTFKPIISLATL